MSTIEIQQQAAMENYGNIPLTFVGNTGQAHASFHYYTQRLGYGIFFTPEEAMFVFKENPHIEKEGFALSLQFLNANSAVKIEGHYKDLEKVNYLIGNDPTKWYTDLPTYREVIYQELWPGTDLVFYGENGRLKYDFVLQPGAKVDDIQLTYRGANDLSLDEEGNLLIHTSFGVLTEEHPVSYQEIDGQKVFVESHFVLGQNAKGESVYGFEVGNDYNPDYSLVIDPILIYSTYLGGIDFDAGNGIVVDGSGNAYVIGNTFSTNFPTTPGAVQTTFGGVSDAFVTKLNATGSALVYSTYLGGNGFDSGVAITVDGSGNAYVTGVTRSTNFPTTPGAFQTTFGGGQSDAFVTKLNTTGSELVYSTYLGGSGDDRGAGISRWTARATPT